MIVLTALLAFAVAMGPLIVFHELGHYSVARLFNVRVLRFSLGFGRPVFKLVRGADQTEWTVGALPFGGFVMMLDEREIEAGRYTEAELARAFNRQSVWKRIAIVAAGPLANFIAAILVYGALFAYGVDEPRALFDAPQPGSIAARAGIEAGDEVKAVDGHAVRSLVSLRFALVQDAVDARDPSLLVAGADGHAHEVVFDFSRMTPKSVESDLLEATGLVLHVTPPTVIRVTPGDPAARAGVQAGDRILAVNGVPTGQVEAFVKTIQSLPGQSARLSVARGAAALDITLTTLAKQAPDDAPGRSIGSIGVELSAIESTHVRYGPVASLREATLKTWQMTSFSARMLGEMVRGHVSLKNLNGPVTIANVAGQSARLGPVIFLSFIAFISIGLGLMNLLPIPLLDGGHLLYYLVEIIQRRPPSERFLEVSQRAGLAVLACLMSVALFNDFSRLLS